MANGHRSMSDMSEILTAADRAVVDGYVRYSMDFTEVIPDETDQELAEAHELTKEKLHIEFEEGEILSEPISTRRVKLHVRNRISPKLNTRNG